MSSISTFGFLSPLVISASNEIIVGEKRLAAAVELGLTRSPVVRAAHLSEAQIRQYRIADNRLNELRVRDPDALREELAEIVIIDPEMSIEAMGFEIAEFDVALKLVDDGPDPADKVGEPPKTGLSRVGDVWEVDGRKVACGDARDAACLADLLGGQKAAAVFADEPFNVKVDGHIGGKGAIKHAEFIMGSGEMSDEEFQAFQNDWIAQASAVTAPGGLLYIASDWRALQSVFVAGRAAGLELLNLAVWPKQTGMGSFYRSAHELFPIWRKPGQAIGTTYNWASTAGRDRIAGAIPAQRGLGRPATRFAGIQRQSRSRSLWTSCSTAPNGVILCSTPSQARAQGMHRHGPAFLCAISHAACRFRSYPRRAMPGADHLAPALPSRVLQFFCRCHLILCVRGYHRARRYLPDKRGRSRTLQQRRP